MNATTLTHGMRARERMPFAWDGITLGLVAALLLVGLIMVTSASMSIAAKDLGDPFYFLERQFAFGLFGVAGAWCLTRVPAEVWDRYSFALLLLAGVLLILVLIPGLGAKINGARISFGETSQYFFHDEVVKSGHRSRFKLRKAQG